ncbi:MAG: glycerate kinase, partial [Muribaculaceae bacterium]|nr:glycerate kinase [Muribaculaceae bacterium]
KERRGLQLHDAAGSGAAGGMAGGLMAFAGGKIVKGASAVLDAIGFDDIIEGADLIITGEGSSDRQTLMGKLPYEILQRGRRKSIPVWLVAGRIADEDALSEAGFAKTVCINSPEIVERSGTERQPPMDPETAERRLSHVWRTHGACFATD